MNDFRRSAFSIKTSIIQALSVLLNRMRCKAALIGCLLSLCFVCPARKGKIFFTVSMPHPEAQTFHVEMKVDNEGKAALLKLPVWTPGYYQKMNYAANVDNFRAAAGNKELRWQKTADNAWQIASEGAAQFNVTYDVKATRQFVANSFLDTGRGYIVPAGLFLHVAGGIKQPIQLTVVPYEKWSDVATGLDTVAGMPYTYTAPDFDVLYDSPLLIGNLETLPAFTVRGIPHRFVGYKMGEFDRVQLVEDLRKMVETASGLIGDIPYSRYTFIAIGPGNGGIEHLNSTTVSFNGSGLATREGRIRTLNFLAHEYFHHYNVKRIRPIELGPFDYDNGSRTNMLWVSEGLTVYYEYLVLRRAGITTTDDLLASFSSLIRPYEKKPGRLFQTLAQASYATWSDGPFGRTNDEVNKTISYYEKGPIVGLLLDLAIRQQTENKRSLDDVMRTLYNEFYRTKKRGFTEDEFRSVCERTAGKPLTEIFEYTTTVRELNYAKYLAYAGLRIDDAQNEVPGAYAGLTVQQRGQSLIVSLVDAGSPAARAGLQAGDEIVNVNGSGLDSKAFNGMLQAKKPGDKLTLVTGRNGATGHIEFSLEKNFERPFRLSLLPEPTPLQKKIFNDWARGH